MKHLPIALILILALSACGKQGPAGKDGSNGLNGTNGSGCSVTTLNPQANAPNGGSLITCATTQSLVLNGTNGVNGGAGTNGTNGTSGTVVAPIQFCSGTPSYAAGNFPEFGFCINHNIYAVYSTNGGFLTEVLPGTWSSNPVGTSACTFTVGADCAVTH